MDIFTKEKRSEIMSKIKSKNTGPEILLQTLLTVNEIQHETHKKGLPGTPDFYFPNAKVAVFVDGDFWHGKSYPPAKPMDKYWSDKIEKNIERDVKVNKELRQMGVKVIRLWEADLHKKPADCLLRIHRACSRAEIYKNKGHNETTRKT